MLMSKRDSHDWSLPRPRPPPHPSGQPPFFSHWRSGGGGVGLSAVAERQTTSLSTPTGTTGSREERRKIHNRSNQSSWRPGVEGSDAVFRLVETKSSTHTHTHRHTQQLFKLLLISFVEYSSWARRTDDQVALFSVATTSSPDGFFSVLRAGFGLLPFCQSSSGTWIAG